MPQSRSLNLEAEEQERLLDNTPTQQNYVPVDRFKAVLIVFFILGTVSLMPWNFFINAKSYFYYKLRNTTIQSDQSWLNTSYFTEDQVLFEFNIEIAAMVPGIFIMFVNIFVTRVLTWRFRICMSLLTMLAMFIVTIVFAIVNTDQYQKVFLLITLLSVAVMSAASSTLQAGVFGLAAMFPKQYTQLALIGGAVAGVISSVANILSLLTTPSPTNSGFGYFITAALTVIVGLFSFILLIFLKFSQYYINSQGRCMSVNSSGGEISNDILAPNEQQLPQQGSIDVIPSLDEQHQLQSSACVVLKRLWIEGFTVFMVFFITLLLFPGINSGIKSSATKSVPAVKLEPTSEPGSSEWSDVYFTPVTCFFLFNFFDFVGRMLPGLIQWPRDSSRLLLAFLSILRVVFIPVFLLSNYQPRQHLPVVFNNDIVPSVATCLFGLSNGYFGTLGMIYGPSLVGTFMYIEHMVQPLLEQFGDDASTSLLLTTAAREVSVLPFCFVPFVDVLVPVTLSLRASLWHFVCNWDLVVVQLSQFYSVRQFDLAFRLNSTNSGSILARLSATLLSCFLIRSLGRTLNFYSGARNNVVSPRIYERRTSSF